MKFKIIAVLLITLLGCGLSTEERRAEYEAKKKAAKDRWWVQKEAARIKNAKVQEQIHTLSREEYKKALLQSFEDEIRPTREYAQEVERLQIEYGLREKKSTK